MGSFLFREIVSRAVGLRCNLFSHVRNVDGGVVFGGKQSSHFLYHGTPRETLPQRGAFCDLQKRFFQSEFEFFVLQLEFDVNSGATLFSEYERE